VVVDARSLREGRSPRGVAVYLSCLLAEPALRTEEDDYKLVVRGRAAFAAAALTGRPRLDRLVDGCDVVWAPAPAPLAVSRGHPLVLTVHDLSFEHGARDFGRYERFWHRLARPRALARRARRVIAVSDAVRSQLLVEWGLAPEKVVAVTSGPGRLPSPAGRKPEGLPASYVLAVGELEPRKRPDLLVDAHARARAQGLQAGLVFAGGGSLRAELETAGAILLGFVPDDRLDALYANALALVCVSREEGFGFTPLEALARGTPPVVSDIAPFRETLGDAALRVPPGDVAALADALVRLEREDGLRARITAAGGEALRRISWERAARATREVLAEAAGA